MGVFNPTHLVREFYQLPPAAQLIVRYRIIADVRAGVVLAELAAPSYATVRAGFIQELTGAAHAYLTGGNYRTTVNAAKRAVVDGYGAAATIANGGDPVLETDDLELLNAEVSAEMGFVDKFWGDLKELRTEGDTDVPAERVEMFARSMDAFALEITARARKNLMVTWVLGDAEKHCVGRGSCTWLAGQRHRMRWFIDKGYVPRKPGAAQVCGGWNCQCSLVDDEGNEITIAE